MQNCKEKKEKKKHPTGVLGLLLCASAVLFHKQGHFVAAIIFACINKYIYKTSLMFYCCFCG